MAEADVPRPMRHWEEQLLGEWAAARHPGAQVMLRVRLGPLAPVLPDPSLTPQEQRMLGAGFRRWADAVIVDGGTLLVVEAAMLADPGKISLLSLYLLLVDVTPELHHLVGLPRRGVHVWGAEDPYARQVALAAGHEVDVFKPSHWGEWLEQKRGMEGGRKTRPVPTRV